jgi:NADH-quinone oxidoreductase subunit J
MDARFPYLVFACVILLLTALGVVLAKKPVYSAVSLLANSLTLAVIYLMLSAEFVAISQLIIYSGAIVVLFLFVVLLLPQGGSESGHNRGRAVAAVIGAGTMFTALTYALLRGEVGPSSAAAPIVAAKASTVLDIGRSLFGPLLIPFELTTLPMLVAIIGAVTLWRRQEKVSRE